MKRFISVILLAVMLCSTVAFAHPFSDVVGHWAEKEIENAYNTGFINGHDNGKFCPDDTVSRAEFVKMLASLISEKSDTEIPDELSDGTHWVSKYYIFSTALIYLPLTENEKVGDIVPGLLTEADIDAPISRWEMGFLIGTAMQNLLYDMDNVYGELPEIAAVYPEKVSRAITYCFGRGIIKGDENGDIKAADNGTRAEAATIMNRVSALIDDIVAYHENVEKEAIAALEKTKKTYTEIPKGHPVVTIEMENGKKIKLELYPEYAPQTVANFVALAKDGFYDGLTFHRIVEGFVAQGGDPLGNGSGQAEHTIVGEFIDNGFEQNTLKHERGVISMARSSYHDSASSQFFICYNDMPALDGGYAAFGKVIDGMEVVDEFLEIERVADITTGEISVPVDKIVIKKVTVR